MVGTLETLRDAIRSRRRLQFFYHGEQRIVEPYTVYRSTPGNVLLYGIQIHMIGTTILDREVKQFKLSEILSLNTLEVFTPDPGYTASKLPNCSQIIETIER